MDWQICIYTAVSAAAILVFGLFLLAMVLKDKNGTPQ